jgi:hypothetical protein
MLFIDEYNLCNKQNNKIIDEDITADLIMFWQNRDLFDVNVVYLPFNKCKIVNMEKAVDMRKIIKQTLVNLPRESRPVMQEIAY